MSVSINSGDVFENEVHCGLVAMMLRGLSY